MTKTICFWIMLCVAVCGTSFLMAIVVITMTKELTLWVTQTFPH